MKCAACGYFDQIWEEQIEDNDLADCIKYKRDALEIKKYGKFKQWDHSFCSYQAAQGKYNELILIKKVEMEDPIGLKMHIVYPSIVESLYICPKCGTVRVEENKKCTQ